MRAPDTVDEGSLLARRRARPRSGHRSSTISPNAPIAASISHNTRRPSRRDAPHSTVSSPTLPEAVPEDLVQAILAARGRE
jgi:hypothetical protein